VGNVVSNTGPLIALASIGQFHLLRDLFDTIFIPPAVLDEVKDERSLASVAASDWTIVQVVGDKLAVRLLQEELDSGEGEAIILANEVDAALLLVDERTATRKARAIGLQTIGTLGYSLWQRIEGC
jgi:predicted nucleic acid-binding protein